MAKGKILLLTALTLGNFNCTPHLLLEHKNPGNIANVTQKTPKNELVREVFYPDIKTWSKGILKTKDLFGCFCCVGYFKKGKEKFGFMSHYPQPDLNVHIKTIYFIKNLWPQMQDYDNAVIIAFRLKEKYLSQDEDVRKYEDDFEYLLDILNSEFPGAKIYYLRYNKDSSVGLNIDNGLVSVKHKDKCQKINLEKILNRE